MDDRYSTSDEDLYAYEGSLFRVLKSRAMWTFQIHALLAHFHLYTNDLP